MNIKNRTPNQCEGIIDLVQNCIDELHLSEECVQRLINNKDSFSTELKKVIERFYVKDEYEDEDLLYINHYPSNYVHRSITTQVATINRVLYINGCADEKLIKIDPFGSTKRFVIPKWQMFAPTYGKAVQEIFHLIKQNSNVLHLDCNDTLDLTQLKQSEKSESAFKKLSDEQEGNDLIVVSAQTGFRHRGRSSRRAVEDVMGVNENESALGVFAVMVILLTHPERIQTYEDLRIICAGDTFPPKVSSAVSTSPCFFFFGNKVRLDVINIDSALTNFGSASMFI